MSGFSHGVLEHPNSSRTAGMRSAENVRHMPGGSERTPAREFFVVWLEVSGVSADVMLTCGQMACQE